MIYILAEGHGEVEAASKLVNKMWHNLSLPHVPIGNAIRWKNLHMDSGIQKGVEFIRGKGNVSGLIILRDDEDNCPAKHAPEKALFLSTLEVEFPICYVIMYREFETLFVSYIDHFRGQTIQHVTRGTLRFKEEIVGPQDPEAIRDAKSFISDSLIGNFSYKPTIDQLTLTCALDIDLLREVAPPCFGTLERGLMYIANNIGKSGIYPSPPLKPRKMKVYN